MAREARKIAWSSALGRILALLCLLVLAAASTSIKTSTREYLAAAGVVLGVFALVLVSRYKPAEAPSNGHIFQPDVDWLFDLRNDAAKQRFNRESGALISFVEPLVNPARCRSRVVETIDLDGRCMRQRVTVEFSLPDGIVGDHELYLPVVHPPKGDLIDNFNLSDASDESLTNLSYEETTRLAALGLRSLLIRVTNVPYGQWTTTREAEVILLGILAKRGPLTEGFADEKIEQGLKMVEGLDQVPPTSKDLLRNYIRALSASYPIVAVVPAGLIVSNRVLLKYERSIMPQSRAPGKESKVRLGLGLLPHKVDLPIDLPLTAGSYHLRVNGPIGKYIYDRHLRCHACKKRVRNDWRGVVPKESAPRTGPTKVSQRCYHESKPESVKDQHYRVSSRLGQNYLHIYMRGYGYSKQPLRNLEIRVHFKETPPGSRASATVIALATTIFVWVVGHLISNNDAVATSDLPALMLALPALAASWFGFTADGGTLLGSSLIARLSLGASGIISIASIITYLLETPRLVADAITKTAAANAAAFKGATGAVVKATARPATSHFAVAGITNYTWIVLFGFSVINFVYILWRFIVKLQYYSKLLQGEAPARRQADPVS
jgi:hypothetical protein